MSYLSITNGALLLLLTITGIDFYKYLILIFIIIVGVVFISLNYYLFKISDSQRSTTRNIYYSVMSMFSSLFIVFVLFVMLDAIKSKQAERNEINQYPALVIINKNLDTLPKEYSFNLKESVKGQYYGKFKSNMTYVSFGISKEELSVDDISKAPKLPLSLFS